MSLIDALRGIVGATHVLVDDELTESFRVDWTGQYRSESAVVVRPADTAELAAVVRVCADHRAPMCPQGGNTGLVGGSVPLAGEVVVSTRRLDHREPVDRASSTVVVGAGVTLGRLQEHARRVGLVYGVDLGARDSATIGGTIATNAGGVHVIRHGMTRANVVGVQAVLADGTVVDDLGGLAKDNTGLHFPSLLCGSEGTLAIVTAARLRLHRAPAERVTALVGFDTVDHATEAVGGLIGAGLPVEAVELMLRDGVELVCSSFDLSPPFRTQPAAFLLVECADDEPLDDRLAMALSDVPGVGDVAVAGTEAQRAALWAYRERHTEAIAAIAPPVKLDVTVPLGRLSEFVRTVPGRVQAEAADAQVWMFGHAGDGNVHVNITGLAGSDAEGRCADVVLSYVIELGGSISAEHGIGRLKRTWLERQRGATAVAAMRAIKDGLDPHGLLQPGVLFP